MWLQENYLTKFEESQRMAHSDIISVNPGKIADGARFPDLIAAAPAVKVNASASHAECRHTDPVASFFFPTRRTGWKSSLALLLFRAALSTLLVMVSGTLSFVPGMAALSVAAAVLVGAGILTRPACILATFCFIYNIQHTLAAADHAAMACGAMTVMLAITGPGRISVDGIVRYAIMRSHRRVARPKSSYKSYRA